MSENNEILSEESKKRLRAEAFKLAQLRDKLEEARAIAEQLSREPGATDYKNDIDEIIEKISKTFARRTYFQALRDIPWTERLWVRLSGDAFLKVAATFCLAAAIASLSYLIGNFQEIIKGLQDFIQLLIPQAHAQAAGAMSIDAKSAIRYSILAIISIGFFCALGIMAFSNKADARKLAADMIKTILGVYVGMATKLID
jgi:hypothetical protein